MRACAIAGLLLVGACVQNAPCRDKTVLISYRLEGAAASAATLWLDLTLPGSPRSTLPSPPARGTIEISFPHGYPKGETVGLTLVAVAADGSTVLATADASVTLDAGCKAVTISVGAPFDLSASAGDLAAPDGASGDLGDRDLAGRDLAGVEAGPPCIPTGPESCYNGVDDDCNGLVDCADPACVPTSTCVPAAPGLPFATRTSAAACPSFYPIDQATRYAGLSTGTTCTGCSCGSPGGCSAPIQQYATGCSGPVVALGTATPACSPLPTPVPSPSNVVIGAPTGTLFCPPSGSPVSPAPYATSARFCTSTVSGGGGCVPGQVCVPRATNQCALVAGAGAACPSGYPAGVTWYGSVSDTRSCGACSCVANKTCSDPTHRVDFYGGCLGASGASLAVGGSACPLGGALSSYGNATFTFGASSCTPTSAITGGVSGSDPVTLCCAPQWIPVTTNASRDFYGVWAGGNDVYVVGPGLSLSTGAILHSSGGGGWSSVNTNIAPFAVWGWSPSDVYAAGSGASILHTTGTGSWLSQAASSSQLYAIWGTGAGGATATTVYAVGISGKIVHSTGSGSWTSQTSGTTANLVGVWGASASDVYVITDSGVVLHSLGDGNWQTQATLAGSPLWIWGSGPSDIYVVGLAGKIFHSTGAGSWSPQTSGTVNDLWAVWGSGANDVYAAGVNGTILHSGGDGTWMAEASGTNATLYALSGTSAFDVYAAGIGATLLHRGQRPPSECGTVGENGALSLGCPTGKTIAAVTFASYGTPTGSCPGPFTVGSCDAATSLAVVQSLCLGLNACLVSASNATFGDPCLSTQKRLSAAVTCQ